MDFDIDIDVKQTSIDKSKYGVRGVIIKENKIHPHPSGYYVDKDMPVDPLTDNSPMDYQLADELGYQKIDILTNSVYEYFDSKEDLERCVNQDPNWELLQNEQYLSKLPHVKDYGYILREIKPKSVMELADVIALIRPGKIHLYESYLENPDKIRPNLYRKPKNDGMYFKKSHAVSYAMMIKTLLVKLENETPFIITGPKTF